MRSLAALNSKRLENTMANVLDVRGALPHIFVAQALIGSSRGLVGPLPGEGSVLMPIPDRLLGGFQEFRIFENKRLRTKNFRFFCSEGLSERSFVSCQVRFGGLDSLSELFPLLSCITNLLNRDLGVHEFQRKSAPMAMPGETGTGPAAAGGCSTGTQCPLLEGPAA